MITVNQLHENKWVSISLSNCSKESVFQTAEGSRFQSFAAVTVKVQSNIQDPVSINASHIQQSLHLG